MRHLVRLLCLVLLPLALTSTAVLVTSPAQSKTWAADSDPDANPLKDLDEFETRILLRINAIRDKRGLKPVRVFESCLDTYAERWAARIKKTGKFEHRKRGQVLNGCDLMWTGENLVRWEYLTPKTAVKLWMDSPSHKAVIMKPRARWAGIGVRIDSKGRRIAVLNFGDPD